MPSAAAISLVRSAFDRELHGLLLPLGEPRDPSSDVVDLLGLRRAAVVLGNCLEDLSLQLLLVERLLDEIVGPSLDGGKGHLSVAVAGDHDRRLRVLSLCQHPLLLEARKPWHANGRDGSVPASLSGPSR